MTAAAIDLLRREIANPDTQWSLGTFGAIAEFSRDRDEPVRLVQSDEAVSAVTSRGGIAIKPHPASLPFASESITRTGWNQRVALCLPEDDCAMNRRAALTEIGPDHDGAARGRSRIHSVRSRPRRAAGGFLRPYRRSRPRRAAARARRPRRVRTRQSGDGNDPRGQSASCLHQPARPHRGLSADPAAFGQEPGGAAHACTAEAAEKRPDPSRNRAHSRWLGSLRPSLSAASGARRPGRGPAVRRHASPCVSADDGRVRRSPDIVIKRRVVDAVLAGEPPTAVAGDRHGRTSIRIALRQMRAEGHASATLAPGLRTSIRPVPRRAMTKRPFTTMADLARKARLFRPKITSSGARSVVNRRQDRSTISGRDFRGIRWTMSRRAPPN